MFDPYLKWLGIPPAEQPPNHYRLLGVPLYCGDAEVIENAADQRMMHLRTFSTGPHSEHSQRMLNEIAAAKIALLDEQRKTAYDFQLRCATEVETPAQIPTPRTIRVAKPLTESSFTTPPPQPPLAALPANGVRTVPLRRKGPWSNPKAIGALAGVLAAAVVLVGLVVAHMRKPLESTEGPPAEPRTASAAASPQSGDAAQRELSSGVSTTATRPAAPVSSTLHEVPEVQADPPIATGGPVSVASPGEPSESNDLSGASSPAPLAESPIEAPETETDPVDPDTAVTASVPPDAPGPDTAPMASPPADAPGPETRTAAEAIEQGLQWLIAHQRTNGSWSFATAPNPGTLVNCDEAATAMALLPLLRAGHTHREGPYKENVEKGLTFLIQNMKKVGKHGGSFHRPGSTMYGHGLCAMALGEAYDRTNDRRLRPPAVAAVAFILYAQDPKGGGWRYDPHQPGDTSVLGWQVQALRINERAGIAVPKRVYAGASKFLDHAAQPGSPFYGYTDPGRGECTTAVGHWCRLELGAKPDDPHVRAGAEYFLEQGPLRGNDYYNYYVSCFFKACGDGTGAAWATKMRQQLLTDQSTSGDAAGSWFSPGGAAFVHDRAGRLGCTSLALMTLQNIVEIESTDLPDETPPIQKRLPINANR